jgi:hypothetical protein
MGPNVFGDLAKTDANRGGDGRERHGQHAFDSIVQRYDSADPCTNLNIAASHSPYVPVAIEDLPISSCDLHVLSSHVVFRQTYIITFIG